MVGQQEYLNSIYIVVNLADDSVDSASGVVLEAFESEANDQRSSTADCEKPDENAQDPLRGLLHFLGERYREGIARTSAEEGRASRTESAVFGIAFLVLFCLLVFPVVDVD